MALAHIQTFPKLGTKTEENYKNIQVYLKNYDIKVICKKKYCC